MRAILESDELLPLSMQITRICTPFPRTSNRKWGYRVPAAFTIVTIGLFSRNQIMDDRWESEVIEYGAINITGFRIVDATRPYVKDFLAGWHRLDPATSQGAGRESISVRIYHPFLSFHSNIPSSLSSLRGEFIFFFFGCMYVYLFRFSLDARDRFKFLMRRRN